MRIFLNFLSELYYTYKFSDHIKRNTTAYGGCWCSTYDCCVDCEWLAAERLEKATGGGGGSAPQGSSDGARGPRPDDCPAVISHATSLDLYRTGFSLSLIVCTTMEGMTSIDGSEYISSAVTKRTTPRSRSARISRSPADSHLARVFLHSAH